MPTIISRCLFAMSPAGCRTSGRFAARAFAIWKRACCRRSRGNTGGQLRIADLGAGNCWLSYRLALRGHRPIAIDILGDPLDGLAAGRHYQDRAPFPRINAEFDDLPLATGSLDAAIYNASIHYSTDYRRTLSEIRRVLRPGRHIPDSGFAGV